MNGYLNDNLHFSASRSNVDIKIVHVKYAGGKKEKIQISF